MIAAADSLGSAAGCLPAPVREAWLRALTEVLSPIAEHWGLAAAYSDSSEISCVVGSREAHQSSAVADVHRLMFKGHPAGAVILSGTNLTLAIREAAGLLVQQAWRSLELEQNERSLLAALGSSWEILGAVYEISGQLQSDRGISSFLDRAVRRVAELQPNLHVAAWTLNDPWLEPRATSGGNVLPARVLGRDPVSLACALRRAVIHNLAEMNPGTAAELANATVVAVVPILAHQDTLGAIEVWREDDNHRLDSHVLGFVESLAMQVGMVLENERLYRTCMEHERLQQQIEISSAIQASLLLGEPPKDYAGLDIASLTIPSQQVDGDFWDFIPQDSQRFDVVIGDVMGKSVPAALVGVAAKTQFVRALAGLSSTEPGTRNLPRVDAIVNRVHDELTGRLIDLDTFVTLCYARCDLKNRALEYVDCGHPKTLHYRWRTGTCSQLQGVNVPLGFRTAETYEKVSVPLDTSDVLVFYSDGLTETMDGLGEQFGVHRLARLVTAHAHQPAEHILQTIRKAAADHAGTTRTKDDLTCVVIKVGDRTATTVERLCTTTLPCRLCALGTLREFVRRACVDLHGAVDVETLNRIVLATHEAAANVIEHACSGDGDDRVLEVRVEHRPGAIAIRLYHHGIVLDAARLPPPCFDPTRDRGFGLYLIHQAMDEAHNSTDASGLACVSLVKHV